MSMFRMGYDAALQGKKLEDCPIPTSDSADRMEWMGGYHMFFNYDKMSTKAQQGGFTWSKYQIEANKTCVPKYFNYNYLCLGFVSKVGQLLNANNIKDKKEKLGDCFWYCSQILLLSNTCFGVFVQQTLSDIEFRLPTPCQVFIGTVCYHCVELVCVVKKIDRKNGSHRTYIPKEEFTEFSDLLPNIIQKAVYYTFHDQPKIELVEIAEMNLEKLKRIKTEH